MADFLDMLRDFTGFTGKIEREMKQKAKAVLLPDEIDLYNFFEKWGGYARCWSVLGHLTSCHTIGAYYEHYQSSNGIEYFIDDNRYHAIKFKDRGTFLVSEERYRELKAKKE